MSAAVMVDEYEMDEPEIPTSEELDAYADIWEVALGLEIARERKAAGLSQGDLAKIIGVSRRTMSDIETGKNPNGTHKWKCCLVLDIKPDLLAVHAGGGARARLITEEDLTK